MTAGSSRLTVAVVDDDADIRRAVRRFLTSHGHTVHVYASAEEFLAHSPAADCAIFDFELPGMTGLELADHLCRLGRHLPVVFMTAHNTLEHLAAHPAPHRQFLRKPLDEQRLLAAIGLAIAG